MLKHFHRMSKIVIQNDFVLCQMTTSVARQLGRYISRSQVGTFHVGSQVGTFHIGRYISRRQLGRYISCRQVGRYISCRQVGRQVGRQVHFTQVGRYISRRQLGWYISHRQRIEFAKYNIDGCQITIGHQTKPNDKTKSRYQCKELTKICWHLIAPPSTLRLLGQSRL